MCARAAAHGVAMTWPAVARRYVESFSRALDRAQRIGVGRRSRRRRSPAGPPALPEINLKHVRAMTDDTGMLQHAVFSIPRYEDGYCLDDNARALLLMTLLEDAGTEDPATGPARSRRATWPSSNHAFDRTSGASGTFCPTRASGSSRADRRTATGARCGRSAPSSAGRAIPGRQSLAGDLFHAALPAVTTFTSPRAWAYALLGIDEYLRAFQGDSAVEALRNELARAPARSVSAHEPPGLAVVRGSRDLLQRPAVAGAHRVRRADAPCDMVERRPALARVAGISMQSSPDGHFARSDPMASIERGAPPAAFDQQPVEACATMSRPVSRPAARAARRDGRRTRRRAFNWFLGQNHLQQWLYDADHRRLSRRRCTSDRMNQNQGAEATLVVPARALRDARDDRAPASSTPLHLSLQLDLMTSPAHYETLFHRHPQNPILTAARLAVPGAHGLQCRRHTPRGRHDAAPLSGRGSARPLASVRRPIRQRRRRLDDRSTSRRSCPIPSSYPEELWGSKIRASPSSTSSDKYVVAYTAFSGRTRRGAGAHRGFSSLRAVRPRHAAGRQGRGAAATPDQRQLRPDPSSHDGLGRAHLDLVFARSAQLGRPQTGAAGPPRRDGGMPTRSVCRRRSSKRRADG